MAGMFESYGDSLGAWGQVVMSILGANAREEERKKALSELQRLRTDIEVPVYQEGKEVLGPSAMAGVQGSPEAKAAQLNALRQLAASSQEGYGDQDRAAIANMMADVNSQERGNRLAIQNRMNPNSGAAMAAQLSNQQAAAQRANLGGLNQAANSRAQALRALSQYGSMAGDIQGQEFGEQAQRAQAMDAVNKFNTQNAQAVAGANVDRKTDWMNRKVQNKMRIGENIAGFHTDTGNNIDEDYQRVGKYHRDAARSGGAGGDATMNFARKPGGR